MNFREKFLNDLRCNVIIKGNKTFKTLATLYGYPEENGENLCKKDYYKFQKSCEDAPILVKGISSQKFEGSADNNRDNSKAAIDLQNYKLASFKLNKEGELCDQWYRSQVEAEAPVDYKTIFKEALSEVEIPNTYIYPNYRDPSERLLIINATDVHLNKKYFQKQTSLREQLNTFKDAITYITNQAQKVDKILFIIGHDLLHSEYNNATTKGTPQDTLESSEVVFKEALKVLIHSISYCNLFAPVDVVLCNGNHAYNAELQLFSALEVFYENTEADVTLTGNRADRQYYEYGDNSFMLIHDPRNKVAELPLVFSLENPKLFVKSNKYILSGHLHSKKETHFIASKENYGIEHIQCPSLSGTDKWHHDNMYIGNKERMLGLVVDKKKGIVNHIIYNK